MECNKILNCMNTKYVFLRRQKICCFKQLQHKSRSRMMPSFHFLNVKYFTSWNVIYVFVHLYASDTHKKVSERASETHIYAVSVECKKMTVYIYKFMSFTFIAL